MKLCQKNLVKSILLVMSMLLCYTIYYEQKKSSSVIELSADNGSTMESPDSDLDLNSEFQIISDIEFSSLVEKQTQHHYFHFTIKLFPPFYSVWQPPRLS